MPGTHDIPSHVPRPDLEGPERQLELLLRKIQLLPALPGELLKILGLCRQEFPATSLLEAALSSIPLSPAARQHLDCLQDGESDDPAAGAPTLPAPLAIALLVAEQIFAHLEPKAGQSVWRHSLRVAVLAELAARRTACAASAAAFVAGLLHDIGKPALARCLPKAYERLSAHLPAQADVAETERQYLGIDHLVIGRRLARHWQLPPYLQDVIWLHHQPLAALPADQDSNPLVTLIHWADQVAYLGPDAALPLAGPLEDLGRRIGISPELTAELRQAMAEPLAELEWICVPTRRPRLAISPAGPAQAPAASPSALPENWAYVRGLLSTLRPDMPLPQICRYLAQAVAAEIGEGGELCFVFSVAGKTALLASSGSAGTGCLRVAACQSWPGGPDRDVIPAGELPALLAMDEAWLDLLSLNSYACLKLTSDGRLVGGILVPREKAGPNEVAALAAMRDLAAFAIACAVERTEADDLAERLADASRHLASAQHALAEARALDSVGEMAAGAAHEMNNPLAVISGRAQLLASQLADPKDRQYAELIVRKAEELSEMSTQLMAFARPEPPRIETIDVADLLQHLAKTAQDQGLPKTPPCPVDIEIQSDCPAIRADRQQVESVLTELIHNAWIAGSSQAAIRIQARRAESAVQLAVIDSGPGMDDATLAMAFVPFFSQRRAGRGRGMGLAIARRAIGANGGRMWIRSRPGHGTRVFVELPAAT